MPTSEHFVILPFIRARKDRIVPGEMRQASSAASAERIADAMAPRFAGVAAYSVMVDKETGDMNNPRLLRRHGETIDVMAEA
ncbi:hypothetical protein ACQKGC_15925 [Allorhizobium pseudoryzae]|uniref:hypothetical protein n=1 Tax=Allorhizobium pseudoryzae TaxID=379684 RepID=UPI003D094095